MAQEIFSGSAVKVYYNTDTGNSNVIAPGNIEITSLAQFPEFSTGSQASSYETYNSEYQEKLLGDKFINDIEIVVNYIPDNQTHQFLDSAYDTGQTFQLNVTYNEDDDLGKSEAVILNGQITGRQINGGRDEAVTMSYTFAASSVVASGTREIAPVLRRGDYGVGSNGSPDYPQYAPDKAEGNAFVKITGSDTDNPAGTDLYGIELVSSGSTVTNSNIMITDSGELRLYARNNDSGWKRYYAGDENDGRYLIKENNLDDLGDVAIARTNLDVYSKGESDSRFLQISNNLSELPDVAAARTKLEIYSKQEGDARYLQITNNLTELTDVEAARTTLDVYSKSENDNLYPLKTYTINTKPLSGNIVLTPTDIGALELTGDKLVLPGDIESTLFDGSLKDYIDAADTKVTTDITEAVEAGYVPITRTINDHALDADIIITKADVGLSNVTNDAQLKIASNLSDVANVTTSRTNLQAAKSGINSDITSLTAINTPIAVGTPINGNQAATKQYVDNLVGQGTVGPTLNGVQNWGVGHAYWKLNRLALTTSELPLDGQVLNRADYPDLWAFAQTLTPIQDAAWLADKTRRGRFSLGDENTTFRLPDLNGVQAGSVPAPIPRGDSGFSLNDGNTVEGALPNITGSLSILADGSQGSHMNTDYGVGALYTAVNNAGGNRKDGFTPDIGAGYYGGIGLNASLSSPLYQNGVTEVRPNSAYGVMVIRAFGGFTATNTTWSVLNATDSKPNTGTIEYGGEVISDYNIAGTRYGSVAFRAKVDIDNKVRPQFVIKDKTSGTEVETVIDIKAGAGKNLCEVYWHHSITKSPAGTIFGNGQVLSRATFPNVVNEIVQGNVPVCTDAEWLADPTKRNCYTLVDADTFRVPDYNGVYDSNSTKAPYLRGSGGFTITGIQPGALPNIKGEVTRLFSTSGMISTTAIVSGAFKVGVRETVTPPTTNPSVSTSSVGVPLVFDANGSNQLYTDAVNEVRPNSIIGAYVIVVAGDSTDNGVVDVLALASQVGNLESTVQTNDLNTNARMGYALISSEGNVALGTRITFENPFGNNTPVFCLAEVYQSTLSKWVNTGQTYASGTSVWGLRAGYSESEGIVLIVGNTGFNIGATMGNFATASSGANYTAASPVRIHVWKVTQ